MAEQDFSVRLEIDIMADTPEDAVQRYCALIREFSLHGMPGDEPFGFDVERRSDGKTFEVEAKLHRIPQE